MMDWKELEAAITAETEKAMQKWLDKNSKHHVYAMAFCESYRELDGQIAFPMLALNSIETLQREQDTKDVELEWNPADWRWENILPIRAVHNFEKQVIEEANRGTQAHWYKTEKRFVAMIVRVAKALRKRFAKHPNTTTDFVVYFDDAEGGLLLVKKCVGAKLFEKLFSDLDDDELEGLSEQQKLNAYFSEPWMYEKQITALGEAAVEPLLKMLDDPKNCGSAPSLLDQLGIHEPRIVEALRKQVMSADKPGVAEQSAITLRFWDDEAFLFNLVEQEETRKAAVRGLLAGLGFRAGQRTSRIPLDYRPAERLLEMKSSSITSLVRSELQPGSSFIEITPSDVDEALRGLESKHAVIRQHAVCVLGERGLGKSVGKKVLPKLAKKLQDKVPNVRRLALLSLSYWKAAAKPYHAEMKKLQTEDPDRDVRICATYVFE